LNRFFVGLGTLMILLWVIGVLCVQMGMLSTLPGLFWEILIFQAFSTTILFLYLYRAQSNFFVQLYLLTMIIKLLAYGGFAVFVILADRPGALLNIGFFLISYLLFTLLELVILYPKINR
jgi:hypothetical protein